MRGCLLSLLLLLFAHLKEILSDHFTSLGLLTRSGFECRAKNEVRLGLAHLLEHALLFQELILFDLFQDVFEEALSESVKDLADFPDGLLIHAEAFSSEYCPCRLS